MQERQTDRIRYFNELATTCEKYFLPYILNYKKITPGMKVLEIGCGDGGNLVPFSKLGCSTLGVDLAASRIEVARDQFEFLKLPGKFIAADIFTLTEWEHQFDLIICHDVLEHIENKAVFLRNIRRYLNTGGILFMSFPAWQMPFGGHQQICRSSVLSHSPFIHLLPTPLYHGLLRMMSEPPATITELLNIKQTRCTIELFERLALQEGLSFVNRTLYFINPHYETKFHLKPRRLYTLLTHITWVRNFFTTSCFYILK